MRFNGLSPEAASNVLAANIVNATEPTRRRLWDPDNEPMTWKGYLASTVAAVAAIACLVFWSAILP